MHPVHDIFTAFGDSPKAIADATGFPIQTVCDWRVKGKAEIPPWRRAAVLKAAEDGGVELPAHCRAYLTSGERMPQEGRAA